MPPKPPQRHRCPPRDWRSLLPNLARMVPWPHGRGENPTEVEVLENVLGYIRYLQSSISIAQGEAGGASNGDPPPYSGTPQLGKQHPPIPPGATGSPPSGHPGDGDSAGDARSSPQQPLVPYEEEEEEGSDPWFCPTGPYWEELGSAEGVPLTPPRAPELGGTLLGLSPSLLASPPPPGSPSQVLRDLFADVYLGPKGTGLSPQAPVLGTAQVGQANGRQRTPGGAVGPRGGHRRRRGQGAPPRAQRPKKKCVNGFIMFCRLNRKAYISAHPGLSSTVATREMAQIWRSLSPARRHPYRRWARRFSRQHERVVRPEGDEDGDSDADPPAPLQLLGGPHGGALGGPPLPP